MNIFLAFLGFLFLMLLLIAVSALVLSPILIPRYLRAKRAAQMREAQMLAEVSAQAALISNARLS